MRRWARVPICKAFKVDHEFGIQTQEKLLRKERKEVIWGTEVDLQGSRVEKTISRREESMFFTLELREKMRNKLVLDIRSHG